METFQSRLLESIERSNLSRTDFAAACGVGTSALAKWLGGKLVPKSEQLLGIAQTADVRMEWLLTGKGPRSAAETLDLGLAWDAMQAEKAGESGPNLTEEQRAQAIEAIKAVDHQLVRKREMKELEERAERAESLLAELEKDLEIALNKIRSGLRPNK